MGAALDEQAADAGDAQHQGSNNEGPLVPKEVEICALK